MAINIYVGMPWKEEPGYERPYFRPDCVIDDLIRDLILHGAFPDSISVDVDLYDEFMGYYMMKIWQYEKDDRFYVFWMREYKWHQTQDPDTPFEYHYVYSTFTFILPKKHCSFVIGEGYHSNARQSITIPQFRMIRDVVVALDYFTEFHLESAEDIEKCFELDPKRVKCYEAYKRKGLDYLEYCLNKHFNKTDWYRAKEIERECRVK